MQFTRTLRQGMTGTDVFYIKERLFSLGYYSSSIKDIKSKTFGKDTVEAVKLYQTKRTSLSGKKFIVNGYINKEVWNAIEQDYSDSLKLHYTRELTYGMSGQDVRYMKDCLFDLGFYPVSVTAIKKDTFGNDTLIAVENFQKTEKLQVTKTINEVTWNAVEEAMARKDDVTPEEPVVPEPEKEPGLLDNFVHIATNKREAIEKELEAVNETRKAICLELLDYAYDKDVEGDKQPRALYVYGTNLYDEKGKINYADKAEIEKQAKTYPNCFNAGRKEWMLKQVERCSTLPAADCSGSVVGYLRKHKLVAGAYDATANYLCGNSASSSISKSKLKPGDWVGKDGHIGTYVGAGYVVEFYGGAQACQLTELDNREGYDFVSGKVTKGDAWTKFRKPKYY